MVGSRASKVYGSGGSVAGICDPQLEVVSYEPLSRDSEAGKSSAREEC